MSPALQDRKNKKLAPSERTVLKETGETIILGFCFVMEAVLGPEECDSKLGTMPSVTFIVT